MPLGIPGGDLECIRRYISGGNSSRWESECARDRDTTAARTYLQDILNSARIDPWFESLGNQFRYWRTRDKDPLVHIERQARKPGFTQKIGERFALPDPGIEQFCNPLTLTVSNRTLVLLGRTGVIKMHRMKYQRS